MGLRFRPSHAILGYALARVRFFYSKDSHSCLVPLCGFRNIQHSLLTVLRILCHHSINREASVLRRLDVPPLLPVDHLQDSRIYAMFSSVETTYALIA